jgi:hypothetical protein
LIIGAALVNICLGNLLSIERCARYKIFLTICNRCGGAGKIIACIEYPMVIKKILDYLDAKSRSAVLAYPL